jgi:aldehyde dehydrogenase (NAD+)
MTLVAEAPAPLAVECRAARAAQTDWERRPVRERLRPVAAFRRLLVDACDELCEAVRRDVGRPPDEVLASDVLPLADACRFLEREAGRLLRPRKVSLRSRPLWLFGQRDIIYRRPHGLVGVIGTWNYPLLLNGVQIVQALTAGNAVLWKPSELSAASAAVLSGLLRRAGYPDGLLQTLPATREGGPALAEADVDHVVFTGSAATGRKLAKRLGERLVSSTLELSGCDALFVLKDADVALAAKAAWFGATLNRGQTCVAVRRAFVQRDVLPAFLESLRPLAASAPAMTLAQEGQVRQADRLIADAVGQGAELIQPSSPPPNGDGRTTVPRVVVNATPAMALCREDCFAPVLAVLPFADVPEALARNAECRYGLGASIFTRDASTAVELAGRLQAGMVAVNDVIVPTAHPATPFGGRGESGWGVTQGPDGLLAMMVPQVVSVRGGTFRPHYDGTGGPDGALAETLRGLLEWSHAPTLGRRWRGLWRMVKGMRRSAGGD